MKKRIFLCALAVLMIGGCSGNTESTETTAVETTTSHVNSLVDLDGDGLPDSAETTIAAETEATVLQPTEAPTTAIVTAAVPSEAPTAEAIDLTETTSESVPETTPETTTSVDDLPYTTMIVLSPCKLRTGPGTEYDSVTSYDVGREVKVAGIVGSWYAVIVNGTIYYMNSDYVGTQDDLAARESVATSAEVVTTAEAVTTATPATASAVTGSYTRTVMDNGAIYYDCGGSITVAVDAGHQGHGNSNKEANGPGSATLKAMVASGTQGITTGTHESLINLIVSIKLRDVLLARGYNVLMVRESQDVDISNATRAIMSNSADIAVIVHCNGSDDTTFSGALTMSISSSNPYIPALSGSCATLSTCVVNYLCAATGAINRSVIYTDSMTSMNWSTIPVTIVELEYMTNPTADVQLNTDSYQNLCAVGMANGIDAYFGITR